MGERQLRRQYRQLLGKLDIRPPLDVAELCSRLGDVRGKPIRLVAHPLPQPGPFGAWISTGSAEYILYQQETSKLHQDHIILHELGHILAGHQSEEDGALLAEFSAAPALASSLGARYPDIEPQDLRRALGRTIHDSAHEHEAESVATIILEWASVVDDAATSVRSEGPARGMDTALGERLGWL